MVDAQELTNTTLEGILVSHNFTWMPNNREDCPCIECQEFLERELAIERQAMWPHAEDYYISLSDIGAGTCVCGKLIEQYNDYSVKKKSHVISAVRHVLVQFFLTTTLGGTIPFKSVTKVLIHRWCVLETRADLDMENQARNILLLEDLPSKGKLRLSRLFEEDPRS